MSKDSTLALPSDADLRRLIHFSVSDGRIWLAGQRMVLVHTAALAALRVELIRNVGLEQTRRYFTRVGFSAGTSDAALARQIRSKASLFDMFAVGPQLHMLEGSVQVTPTHFEADPATGHYRGEFRWDNSWEAEVHKREFGIQHSPVCWMLVGYASGYTSALMGHSIIYKEKHCMGCGDAHCDIIGKPQEQWSDAKELASYFREESMLSTLQDLQARVESLQLETSPEINRTQLIGRSEQFMEAYKLLHPAAETNVTVLLTGETGVGKELFARALHDLSLRAKKPFVAINCAAIPQDLIESELFGTEKGAYTGAFTSRKGRFERAENGTLFLDEIGELSLQAQAKLLRVIQDGVVERLGATINRKIDVRLVAATNQDLEQAMKDGRFRADLFYRINVYPIMIPPLRKRRGDIEPLTAAMLKHFSSMHNKPVPVLTDYAYQALRTYDWPGNVRELQNIVERTVILSKPNRPIDAQDIFPTLGFPSGDRITTKGQLTNNDAPISIDCRGLLDQLNTCGGSLNELEQNLLQEAVERAGGNLSAAARILGITRPQLSYRLQHKRTGRARDHE